MPARRLYCGVAEAQGQVILRLVIDEDAMSHRDVFLHLATELLQFSSDAGQNATEVSAVVFTRPRSAPPAHRSLW